MCKHCLSQIKAASKRRETGELNEQSTFAISIVNQFFLNGTKARQRQLENDTSTFWCAIPYMFLSLSHDFLLIYGCFWSARLCFERRGCYRCCRFYVSICSSISVRSQHVYVYCIYKISARLFDILTGQQVYVSLIHWNA